MRIPEVEIALTGGSELSATLTVRSLRCCGIPGSIARHLLFLRCIEQRLQSRRSPHRKARRGKEDGDYASFGSKDISYANDQLTQEAVIAFMLLDFVVDNPLNERILFSPSESGRLFLFE